MEKFEKFMELIELSHETKGTDWIHNRRLLRLHLRKLIESEIENCNLHNVSNNKPEKKTCNCDSGECYAIVCTECNHYY